MADPIYRRIAENLRLKIESGELAPGAQLPTEFELRDEYSASRNTIRDAVRWLMTRGLVETRPGQGTFVTQTIDPFVTTLSADPKTGFGGGEGTSYLSEVSEHHRRPQISDPQVEVQACDSTVAGRLRVPEGSPVISRHQKRYIDNLPWSLQTTFYPMDLVLRGAQRLLEATDIQEGTVKYLGATLGIEQVGYRDWITARTPDENEVRFFQLPDDGRVIVFEQFRTAFDKDGNAFRLTVSIFPTDRNQFIINVGEVPSPQFEATPPASNS